MNAIQILLLSVMIFGINAIISLFLRGFKRAARVTSGLLGAVASFIGLIAAVLAFFSPPSPLEWTSQLPFGHFVLQLDALSAFMVAMISGVSFAVCVYSISYLEHYANRDLGVLGFFTNLFIAMMLLVVTVADAFYFLIFWEMMTLASYFLVIFEGEKKESIQAGYLYMLVAHAGTALILLSFFVFYSSTGSFDFDAFRQAQLTPALRNLIFLLGFIGFGAKAGVVPLHIWLPRAHPAAPSHVSALLSGVMIKTAIYGILRLCVDLLGASVLWWGVVIIFFGAVSAVMGALFALAEHDVKRVLAYSSVENIGIILLGVGTGMIGLAIRQPIVSLLGFLAALYHALNHSLFKSLLFLGAGSVDYRLHTRNLNEMGGLGRLMPFTTLAFLIGALSMAAIPPFNGFVSEWLTYQAFFTGSGFSNLAVRAILPLSAMILALTGTLAAMVAIKMYGGAFAGPAKESKGGQVRDVPGAMLTGMILLAITCIGLGVGSPWIVPAIANTVTRTLNITSYPVARSVWVFPASDQQALLSPPFVLILLLGLLVVPVLLVAVYHGYKAGRRTVKDPWTCGYGYTNAMSISSSSFDQPVAVTFSGVYGLRFAIKTPLDAIAAWSKRVRERVLTFEPVIENMVRRPAAGAVEYIGRQIQALQMGDIRMYCFYIILTLVILLIVIFR